MSTLYVFPTRDKCNKNSSFCITKSQMKDNKEYPQFLSIDNLDCRMIDDSMKGIEITGGGEPTLNDELPDIIKFFKREFQYIPIHLYTNGIKLVDIPLIDTITISTSLEELTENRQFSETIFRALKHYKNFCDDICIHIHTPLDKIDVSQHKLHPSYMLWLCMVYGVKYVFGTDFDASVEDVEKLKHNIRNIVCGKAFSKRDYKNFLFMYEKGIINIDDNSRKCANDSIIYTDGNYNVDWSEVSKSNNSVGYHITPIEKGEYGEASKIFEELEELKDAINQNNKIMVLLELSDIIGSIEGYLEKYHSNIGLSDLIAMSKCTERAFKNGIRKN